MPSNESNSTPLARAFRLPNESGYSNPDLYKARKLGSGVPMILTVASSKGGCGKTTLARIILGRLALAGYSVAAVDADFNHSLTDWVRSISHYPIAVEHELRETEVGPLVSRLHEAHDVVIVDTAGAATQATVFAIGAADLVLVPVMT